VQSERAILWLKLYIEMGDIRLAARVAGMSLEEFRVVLRAARVPAVA